MSPKSEVSMWESCASGEGDCSLDPGSGVAKPELLPLLLLLYILVGEPGAERELGVGAWRKHESGL